MPEACEVSEKFEQQRRDSDMIFTQISTGDFDNFETAQLAVVLIYIPDMTISRAGISHALKRLEKFYQDRAAAVIEAQANRVE